MSHKSHWGSADALDHAHITLQNNANQPHGETCSLTCRTPGGFEPACSIFAD